MAISKQRIPQQALLSSRKMKLTSSFLAILGLAVCQLAAAGPVPEDSAPRTINVQYFLERQFQGASRREGPPPGDCVNLTGRFRDTIRSIRIGEGASCYFYTRDDCKGSKGFFEGSTPALSYPLDKNTLSYVCNYLTKKTV